MDETEIKQAALGLGFTTVGIAPAAIEVGHEFLRKWLNAGWSGTMDYMVTREALRMGAERLLPNARSVIVVTLNYFQPGPPRPGYSRIAQYAKGRDYHKVLRSKLKRLASNLDPSESHRVAVDSAPVLERAYAHAAGLGWFGKNTMLIDSRRGSWFFIGTILTTQALKPDRPSLGGCGSCRACIDACPTGAIQLLEGRYAVDSRKCISYLNIEHRGDIEARLDELHGWTFGCDICQEVCPFNQPRPSQPLRAQVTSEPDLNERALPSLADLAMLSEAEWSKLTEGRALRRAGYDRLTKIAQHQAKKREPWREPDGDPTYGDKD